MGRMALMFALTLLFQGSAQSRAVPDTLADSTSLIAVPTSETVFPKERCDSAEFRFNYYLEGVSDTSVVSLWWRRAPQFPEPSRYESEDGDFAITCDDFSAEQSSGVFKIRGKSIEDVVTRLDGVRLLYVSGYQYPHVRVGFWQSSLNAWIRPTQVTFDADDWTWWRKTVIAARVNDGPLQPAVFEGKVTPVHIRPGDHVDFYIKNDGFFDNVRIARFSVDMNLRELTFWRKSGFPPN